jgi:hypothetical protein
MDFCSVSVSGYRLGCGADYYPAVPTSRLRASPHGKVAPRPQSRPRSRRFNRRTYAPRPAPIEYLPPSNHRPTTGVQAGTEDTALLLMRERALARCTALQRGRRTRRAAVKMAPGSSLPLTQHRPGRNVSDTTASGVREVEAGTEDTALLLMRERALARCTALQRGRRTRRAAVKHHQALERRRLAASSTDSTEIPARHSASSQTRI